MKQIRMRGTLKEVKEQIELLKRKYGADTPIIDFIDCSSLWIKNQMEVKNEQNKKFFI